MKLKFDIIPNEDLTNDLLKKIVELKDLCWPHGIDSQLLWIKNNISNGDLHLLVSCNNQLIGYCDLIQGTLLADEKKLSFYGLGNLCVHPNFRKQGYGLFLLKQCKKIVDEHFSIGLLLCNNKETCEYYYKHNCKNINEQCRNIIVAGKNANYTVMLFSKLKIDKYEEIRISRYF